MLVERSPDEQECLRVGLLIFIQGVHLPVTALKLSEINTGHE